MSVVYEPSATTHWKNLFPNKMLLLGSQNLNAGEELVAEIDSVEVQVIKSQKGDEEQVPVVKFTNAPPMVLNITNAKTIAGLYGNTYDLWKGRSIQVYAVPIKAFGQQTEALRVREAIPDTNQDLSAYEELLRECKSMDDLKKTFGELPKHLKPKLVQIKDEVKEILQ